jgi:hypothetical protein
MNSQHKHTSPSGEGNDRPTPLPTIDRSVSKVEVTGFEARHYDLLMNLITVGTYPLSVLMMIF